MPTVHNSPIYKDEPAALGDAAQIVTLRTAGAIIFGKTTTTEFASTTVGGPSANPHDPSRSPDGSSGSVAAVGDYQARPNSFYFKKRQLTRSRYPWVSVLKQGAAPSSVCPILILICWFLLWEPRAWRLSPEPA